MRVYRSLLPFDLQIHVVVKSRSKVEVVQRSKIIDQTMITYEIFTIV